MTVRHFKKLLESYNDSDRIILDNGGYEATKANEIIFAHKIKVAGEERPIVICQTRGDFDVPNELEAQIEHFQEEKWDEADALMELMEYGFTIDDFRYDKDRYEWVKQTAEEHGLI